MTSRFWEIDFFRGIAIVTMLLFNWSYALAYLGVYTITDGDLYWWLFPRLIASTFIIVAGIVLSIGYAKNKDAGKYVKRGAGIFAFGLLITAATWIFVPNDFIIFGILHFIGLSIMISPIFLKQSSEKLLTLSLVFIAAGFMLQYAYFDFPWLLWLGLMPYNFTTLDYFPMLPWFGIMLLGIVIGNIFYANGKRQFKIREALWARPLTFLGRHSLAIYLVHQPILLLALRAAGLF